MHPSYVCHKAATVNFLNSEESVVKSYHKWMNRFLEPEANKQYFYVEN